MGARQSGSRHARFGIAEVAHIHRHRLGPAYPYGQQQKQTHPVDVGQRVEGKPPIHFGGRVPQLPGDQPVGELVDGQADETGHGAHQKHEHSLPVHMV